MITQELCKQWDNLMNYLYWDEYEDYIESLDCSKELDMKLTEMFNSGATSSSVMRRIPNGVHNKKHIFWTIWNLQESSLADYIYKKLNNPNYQPNDSWEKFK